MLPSRIARLKKRPRRVATVNTIVERRRRLLSKYIFYIYIVLYLTLVGASLKSVDVSGERTRSDIILGRLRTGIYTNMMVRTDHVWSCLILMIKVRSL